MRFCGDFVRLKLDLLHRDTYGVSFGLLPLPADPALCHSSAAMYSGRRVSSLDAVGQGNGGVCVSQRCRLTRLFFFAVCGSIRVRVCVCMDVCQAEGDEFEIRVSFQAPGTIEFVRNGVLQYTHKGFDVKREQFLALCLYHNGTKVTQLAS